MNKATALLVTVVGVLALAGAGCNNTEEQINQGEGTGATASTSTTYGNNNETTTVETTTTAIEATAEAKGNGVVDVQWTVPANFDKNQSFQVLHSSKPNPSHPTAFWFQYMNAARQTELSNVAVGKRYFRVCAFDLGKNECTSFSNEIELDVK